MEKQWKQWQTLFLGGAKITADGDCSHEIKRCLLAPWKKSYDQTRWYIKKQRHYLANKAHLVKAIVYPSHVWMWELDYRKKAEHWRIDAFELWCWSRLLKSPLDCKEIQPVHPKGNQSWIFIGRTDVEAETPILWPPDVQNWLIWEDSDAGKDWKGEEKVMTGWNGWMASPIWWN